MIGSWAGELGQTQFLPTHYLAHAEDYDGDGRRELSKAYPKVIHVGYAFEQITPAVAVVTPPCAVGRNYRLAELRRPRSRSCLRVSDRRGR